MKPILILLLLVLLNSCNSSPSVNENWDNGSPKIRIEIKENHFKKSHPKYFYRKYVRYYTENESDTLSNYFEEWYSEDDNFLNGGQIKNGEREGKWPSKYH